MQTEESIAPAKTKGFEWPLTRWDIAGAFGDIGILFPIAIALISLNHMNPTAVFLAAGLAYILAGAYFKIPMPVQPFKAVAAIALALQLPPSSIASAGLMMGILLTFIGLTNLVTPLARLFTLPVIRGIQLGLGLILLREGLRLISHSALVPIKGISISPWWLALAGGVILLALLRSQRFPAALALLIAGVAFGFWSGGHTPLPISWGPVPFEYLHPHSDELKRVLIALVLPQFALTFGNSIVATENTAAILYWAQARRVTARALSVSIGLMNLVSSAILAAPMCHGSGGVTAHYKFGARSEKSTYVIGGVCLLLALFGQSAITLLHLIPTAVLGVFLIYVGIQHAMFIHDLLARKAYLLIAVCVGIISLVTTNLTYGFLAGFLLHGLLMLYEGRSASRKNEVTAVQ
ncbi:MAG TPA: putative sulfate/molybdate transporter [Terriglobia bacterium]|nr:putative sulfate/molybdate transporter [Terriglobia bacterium]